MIQVGGVNVVDELVNAELRLGTLEKAFDFILNNNFSMTKPSQQDIENFKAKTVAELQAKYPSLGLTAK
jgi:glucuronate isomerase